jgi:hypothetical protein
MSAPHCHHTRTFTDFQDDPRGTAQLAASGPVHLRRRNAPDLVLVSADSYEEPADGTEAAFRYLSALTETQDFAQATLRAFPWSDFLPPDDFDACVAQLKQKLAAAVSLSTFGKFQDAVDSWRGTAETYALGTDDEGNLEEISEPLTNPTPFARP